MPETGYGFNLQDGDWTRVRQLFQLIGSSLRLGPTGKPTLTDLSLSGDLAVTGDVTVTGSGRFDGGIAIGTDPSARLLKIYKSTTTLAVGLEIDNLGQADAIVRFALNSVAKFTLGVDNSVAGDPFKITVGSALGTNDALTLDSSGDFVIPGDISGGTFSGATISTGAGSGLLIDDVTNSHSFLAEGDNGIDGIETDGFILWGGATQKRSLIVTGGDWTIDQDVSTSGTPQFTGLGVGIASPVSIAHIYEDTANNKTTAGLTIEQDGAGDALLQFNLTGVRRFLVGVDNDGGDAFRIAHVLEANKDSWSLGQHILSIDIVGNMILNNTGYTGGGKFTTNSKVDSDTIVDIFDASLNRGSAVGGAGLGLGYLFRLENGAGNLHDAGKFEYIWTDSTDTAEDSKFIIKTMKAGSFVDAITIEEDTTLFAGKAAFTQTDGNEYIDSLNDGYMDYGATTGHRFNAPVGIGTTAPDSIFHIKANVPGTVGSHPAGQLIIQDPDDTVFGNAVITGYESDGAGNPDQQLWYLGSSSSGDSNIIFLNRRNSKLQLGTNGVSRLTILGNGNVGIGRTDPTAALSMGDDKLIAVDVNAGLTASTTQSQGQGALTAQVNEISTVANNNDTVTLPSAVTGIMIEIINNGANTLQIFPASGDDLGLGVNTAEELEANERVGFVAYDTTNWAKEFSTEIIHAEIHDEDNTDAFVINDAGGDFHSYHTNGLVAGDLADWAFDAGGAGTSFPIASIADGADSGVDIAVTTTGTHGLEVGDIISQTNLTDAAYVGVFVVKAIISTTVYEVAAAYTADGTGTMDQAATLEANAVAAGVYSFAYCISGTSSTNNETVDFQLHKEATAVVGSKVRRKFGTASDFGAMSGCGVVTVASGDKISLALSNEDSAGNITLRNFTLVLIRL